MVVPGAIYLIQNLLTYVGLRALDGSTYAILVQLEAADDGGVRCGDTAARSCTPTSGAHCACCSWGWCWCS